MKDEINKTMNSLKGMLIYSLVTGVSRERAEMIAVHIFDVIEKDSLQIVMLQAKIDWLRGND